ncbi:MAG: methyltransferase domain-containing protein [Cyanobacteria bacterium]|nr:methyltransferase domain-containing protein [Cyanobacteriota bacterium]
MSTITTNWFHETHKDHHSLGMSQKEVLYHERSDYQDVLVYENELYGTVLVLDGCYMLSDLDEHMYHKALTTYGLQNLTGRSNLNILVIGAGDGGIVRDLLRNWDKQIDKVTMVEIDQAVIDVSKKFFPQIAAEFDNPKLDLKVQDALEFIKSAPDASYDLVLCDSTDPEGFAAGLIEVDFYQGIKRIMKEDGVFCAQSGSPIFMKEELEKTQTNLVKVFDDVHTYYAPMLVYPGSLWSYTAAGKSLMNKNNLDLGEFVAKS